MQQRIVTQLRQPTTRQKVAHGNRLAIEWEATQNDPRAGITVVGLDGKPYATYNEKLGVLACYSDQERFTFLGGTELRFAQPR